MTTPNETLPIDGATSMTAETWRVVINGAAYRYLQHVRATHSAIPANAVLETYNNLRALAVFVAIRLPALLADSVTDENVGRDAERWRFVREQNAEIEWSGPATWRVVLSRPGEPGSTGYNGRTLDDAIDIAMTAITDRVREAREGGMTPKNGPIGQAMTGHTLDCPALLAWDIPGACTCGGRRTTPSAPAKTRPEWMGEDGYADVRAAMTRLTALIDDPHPGLVSWSIAVVRAREALLLALHDKPPVGLGGEPEAEPGREVGVIAEAVTRHFRTFGGGRYTLGNPVSMALADQPAAFAAGVDVRAVVAFVLARATRPSAAWEDASHG